MLTHNNHFLDEYVSRGIAEIQEEKVLEWLFRSVSSDGSISPEAEKILSKYLSISDLINSENHYGNIALNLPKKELSILRSLCFLESFMKKKIHFSAHTSDMLLKYCRKGPLLLKPELRLLCTDSNLNVIYWKTIQKGSIDPTSVNAKSLLQLSLEREAYGFFLVENKLHENSMPSEAEINLSKALRNCADNFNISFHDYILYGKDTHFSFRMNHYI